MNIPHGLLSSNSDSFLNTMLTYHLYHNLHWRLQYIIDILFRDFSGNCDRICRIFYICLICRSLNYCFHMNNSKILSFQPSVSVKRFVHTDLQFLICTRPFSHVLCAKIFNHRLLRRSIIYHNWVSFFLVDLYFTHFSSMVILSIQRRFN